MIADALEIPVEVAPDPQRAIALGASAPVREPSAAPGVETLAEGVLAAAVCGARIVAVIEGEDGPVIASGADVTPLRGGAIRSLACAGEFVLAVTDELATLFDAELHPLAARRRPLAAALGSGVAWVVVAGEGAPRLITYALARGVAAVVGDEPLAPTRRAAWRPRRGTSPPTVLAAVGDRCAFAVASGGGQITGWADGDGVSGPVAVIPQAPWTFGLGEGLELRGPAAARAGWVAAPAALLLGGRPIWSAGAGEARLLGGWLAVASAGGWELRRAAELVSAGEGAVHAAGTDGAIAWLVVGETSLVVASEEVRRHALPEPLVPVGIAGERVIALRDGRLVALGLALA